MRPEVCDVRTHEEQLGDLELAGGAADAGELHGIEVLLSSVASHGRHRRPDDRPRADPEP